MTPTQPHFARNLASEGDVNLSARRRQWEAQCLDDATRAMLAEDSRHFLHQSLSTPCFNALKASSGIWLEDLQGRRIMDFHGNSVHQVGYGHPKVVAAMKEALDVLPFSPRRFTNRYAVDLAARLTSLAPGDLNRVLFAPGGAEAIGIALKLARIATGRHKTVSMWDAFHGASLDAISIGGEAIFRRGVGPLLPGTEHVPPCDPRDCRFKCGGACDASCADYVEYVLGKEEDVAAVVVETVRATDVQAPPPEYYRRLREYCDRHGALLILDEIPSCLGRTGKIFAFEHYGIVPDMVVIGKGLGGAAFPMAAVIVREGLNVAADRALGHYTHEKSSLGCAAALATLDVIESEGLLARTTALGKRALARMKLMQSRQPSIVDVRNVGLFLAIELDRAQIAEDVMYRCLSKGLSFKVGQGTVLVLAPPLIIAEHDLDGALDIVESSITEATSA